MNFQIIVHTFLRVVNKNEAVFFSLEGYCIVLQVYHRIVSGEFGINYA